MQKSGNLDALFAPKSIAVIGASNRQGSVGRAVFTNILLNEYKGTVYPVNPKDRLNASFASQMPLEGSIAFASQSGALGEAVIDYATGEGIGFSKFISVGNKADVNENDILEYLREDPKTKVILLYIEDIVDGRKFVDTVSKVTEEKPIIAVKAGVSPEGAKAASSHTGALAGSDEAYNAILKQSGVLRVESIIDLFDYARAFAKQSYREETE